VATTDVNPLGKYLSEVRAIRKRWKVPKNNELWFRAEDSSYRKTHLQPGLYRPKVNGTRLPSTSSLLKLENHLYEEFNRMGTQLSDARSLSDDWEWDSYFLMQHHGSLRGFLTGQMAHSLHCISPLGTKRHLQSQVRRYSCWTHIGCSKRSLSTQIGQMPKAGGRSIGRKTRMMYTRVIGTACIFHRMRKMTKIRSSRPPSSDSLDSPHVTRRVAAQRSRFMIFGTDPTWLAELRKRPDSRIAMISIHASSVVSIKQELRDAGVTESVVFPDLDGLGRELKQKWNARR